MKELVDKFVGLFRGFLKTEISTQEDLSKVIDSLIDFQKKRKITRSNLSLMESIGKVQLPPKIPMAQLLEIEGKKLTDIYDIGIDVFNRCNRAIDKMENIEKGKLFYVFQHLDFFKNELKINNFICVLALGGTKTRKKAVWHILKQFYFFCYLAKQGKKGKMRIPQQETFLRAVDNFIFLLSQTVLELFVLEKLTTSKNFQRQNFELESVEYLSEIIGRCMKDKHLKENLLRYIQPPPAILLKITDYYLILQSDNLAYCIFKLQHFYTKNKVLTMLEGKSKVSGLSDKNVRKIILLSLFSNPQLKPSKEFWKIAESDGLQATDPQQFRYHEEFLEKLTPHSIRKAWEENKRLGIYLGALLSIDLDHNKILGQLDLSIESEAESLIVEAYEQKLIPEQYLNHIYPLIQKIKTKQEKKSKEDQRYMEEFERYVRIVNADNAIAPENQRIKNICKFEFVTAGSKIGEYSPNLKEYQDISSLFVNQTALLESLRLVFEHLFVELGKTYEYITSGNRCTYVKILRNDQPYLYFIGMLDVTGKTNGKQYPYFVACHTAISNYKHRVFHNITSSDREREHKFYYISPVRKGVIYYDFLLDLFHMLNAEQWYSPETQTCLSFLKDQVMHLDKEESYKTTTSKA